MASEQELKNTNPLHKEFQALLEKDLKLRTVKKEGEIIEATITEITPKFVIVEANLKAEGMIDKSEFTSEELSKLKIGSTLQVYLDRVENHRGQVVISRNKAKQLQAWNDIVKLHKEDKVANGTIKSRVKGGMVVEISNFLCFMPSSQLDLIPVKNTEKFFNTPLKFKIIKIDTSRYNAIASRRQVLSESKDIETKELMKDVKVGQKIKATCVGLTNFGAFFNFQKKDSPTQSLVLLAHISDLSWSRLKHPSEILSVGDERDLIITKIDKETNRLSCSIKDLVESPFKDLEKKYEIGKIYSAKAVRILDYGIFFQLESAVEALCHKSECSFTDPNVQPKRLTSIGKTHDVRVINVEPETNKISVSLKIGDNPYDKLKEQLNENIKIKVHNITDKGVIGIIEESKISTFLHWKECSFDEKIENLKNFKKGAVITVKIKEINGTKVKVSKREVDEKDPWAFFKENNKKEDDVITTRVHEVLKSGAIKVFIGPDKKIISTIKKSDLAKDAINQRSDIYSGGEKLDAKILSLDLKNRIIKLSPKEAQLQEEASLIKKFGSGATKSGIALKEILEKAIGSKKKKKEDK